jgi:NodT family efflux transporter outer membrane factor (OMF) lipoprotein
MTSILLTGCQVGPDYVRPEMDHSATFKESVPGWKAAAPGTIDPNASWWAIFEDTTLNDLEAQVIKANQTLAQAKAQYDQAKTLVAGAQATYFPGISAGVSETRGEIPLSGASQASSATYNTHSAFATATWETNIWGATSRSVEAAKAGFESSAAALSAAQLVAQSALAQSYFQIRALDQNQTLLEASATAYKQLLAFAQVKMTAGTASALDVMAAENQYKTALNQASSNTITRSQTEHALAVLLGKTPAAFTLTRAPLTTHLPEVPVCVASSVLERRPDIAKAERLMAQANANIGIAKSAFFPDLSLGATGGYESHRFSKWLTAPMQYWSLGPQLATALFDGGARSARLEGAKASYEASIAAYKQTVLSAFQDVEDQLASLRSLEAQGQTQNEAVTNGQKSLALVEAKHRTGMASQIDVLNAQTALYSLQVTQTNLIAQRLIARIALIKAMGGRIEEQKQ